MDLSAHDGTSHCSRSLEWEDHDQAFERFLSVAAPCFIDAHAWFGQPPEGASVSMGSDPEPTLNELPQHGDSQESAELIQVHPCGQNIYP